MAQSLHEEDTSSSDVGSVPGSSTSDIVIVDAPKPADISHTIETLPRAHTSSSSPMHSDSATQDDQDQPYSNALLDQDDNELSHDLEGQRQIHLPSETYSRPAYLREPANQRGRTPRADDCSTLQPEQDDALPSSDFMSDQSAADQHSSDSQYRPYGSAMPNVASHANTRTSTGHPTARLYGAVTPAQAPVDDDTGNLLKIVAHKFQQKEANLNAGFAAERNALRFELDHNRDTSQKLERQVKRYHATCEKLTAEIHTFKTTYATKLSNFSKFMGGLGNDLASLRREGDVARGRSEDARSEIEHMQERLMIMSQHERSLVAAKLTQEKLLDTKSCDLQLVIEHRDSLKSQLDDRIGQLAEERDRSLAFQQRIRELESGERALFGKRINQMKDSVLSRLEHIGRSDDNLSVAVDGIHWIVQEFGARKLAGVPDCDDIKTSIVQLASNVNQCQQTLAEMEKTFSIDPNRSVQEGVDNAVQELHTELTNWKTALEQHYSDRESQSELSAQLQHSIKHAEEIEAQFLAARAAEARLDATVITLTAQIRDLEATHGTETGTPIRNQATIERLVKDAEAKARKRMAENAKAFQVEQQAAFDNQLKKAINERDRTARLLNEKINQLQRSHVAELEQSKSDQSSSSTEAHRQLGELKALMQKNEVDLKAARATVAQKTSLEARHTALAVEAETTKAQLSSLREDHGSLTREMVETRVLATQSRSAAEQANALLEKLRGESEATMDDMKRKLSNAEENAQRAAAGSAQLKHSGEKAMQDAKEKNRRQVEALQERLAEAEAEAQDKARETEAFRQSIEQSWTREQSAWQEKLGAIEQAVGVEKAAKEESAKLEEQLRHEHGTLQIAWQDKLDAMEKVVEAEKASKEESAKLAEQLRHERDTLKADLSKLQGLAQQTRSSSNATKTPATPWESSNADDTLVKSKTSQITPTDVAKPTVPPRLRKKVDRNVNRVAQAPPIPAPEVIRPRSRSTVPDQTTSNGPLVDDSQFKVDQVLAPIVQQDISHLKLPDLVTRSSNSDEMLDISQSQRLRETVPETQSDDYPATFADFNNSLTSPNAVLSKPASIMAHGYWAPEAQARRISAAQPTGASRSYTVTEPQLSQVSQEPSFQIFEDSPSASQRGIRDHANYDGDEYTFRMPMPKPNSASKRLPRNNSNTSQTSRTAQMPAGRYHTPDLREKALVQPGKNQTPLTRQISADHSSTPPFLKAIDTHKMNKYSSGGSSKKRRVSRTNSFQPADPRIAAKAGAQKRAAERESQQEYQPTPKRRIVTGVEPRIQRKPNNEQANAGSSQSVNDLPRITKPVRRNDSSSRTRTFGGSSSRTAGGRGKVSKNDEYGARFSQELSLR